MLSPFVPWSADECINAFECEGEKPHQGVAGKNPALHLGITWSNSTTALGLRGVRSETRVGSRCTGKERDAESGLDYFGARYYGSSMGRWMSPDWSAKASPVPYAKMGDPQSLNLYAYVGNNPLSRADADGHTATCGAGANAGTCAADLNKLAPGTKVAADGTVSKGSLLQRIVNHLDGNGAGQSLVSRIVNDSHLTTITADPGNPRGGQQLNGDVKYDPAGANIMTRGADGNLTGAHASGAVVLGHELIHQDHENRGLQDMSPADHIFSNAGGMFSETVNREEFRTTGF